MNNPDQNFSLIKLSDVSSDIEPSNKEKGTHEFISEKIDSVTKDVLQGKKSILDSTIDMGILAQETINKVVQDFVKELNLDISNLPFGIFLFGSPSRNLMLPNSDLDIGMVFTDDCSENIKDLLKEKILELPFDKIDIAGWSTIEGMKKENCPDMIEYSKATDAKFICGNNDISQKYTEQIRNADKQEDKISRFITEFGLFHKHDYLNKRTQHGPNLKYDFGASRDIIFLDWFYIINGENNREEETSAYFIKGLDLLLEKNFISSQEYSQLKLDIELILLVKFTLRSKYVKNNDEMLLRLSSYSLHECFFEAKDAFQKLEINNPDQLIDTYYDTKLSLDNLVCDLYEEVSKSNQPLVSVWEVAKNSSNLNSEVFKILESKTWYELVPFATLSKSPEILGYVIDSIAYSQGYEYILRIISENKFINDEIKHKLLNSNLADKFKKKLITI